MSKPPPSIIVGIAGGTATGKSTLTRALLKALFDDASLICLDSYYRDRSKLPLAERGAVNYDHPDAFEFDLLAMHLKQLAEGNAAEVPVYDYSTHSRSDKVNVTEPARIILVEGILSLYPEALRKLYALKIFVDTPGPLCLERRMERDMRERGRTKESVMQQWNETVYPMYRAYCKPAREYADLILDGREAVDKHVALIKERLDKLVSRPPQPLPCK